MSDADRPSGGDRGCAVAGVAGEPVLGGVALTAVFAALREMTALYDGLDTMLVSEGVKAKVERARAALRLAEGDPAYAPIE